MMSPYKDIPIWENSRRMRILKGFQDDAVTYFNNSRRNQITQELFEEPVARKARRRINLTIEQVRLVILATSIDPDVTLRPQSEAGECEHKVDLISDLFMLDRFQISADHAVDRIERAIGVYQSDRSASFRRTLNPLWWLYRTLRWFTRIPFAILGAIGFDKARAEASILGKFLKLLIAASALLTILNLMGWLLPVKKHFGID